jgi:hypothetical protein
MLLVYTTYLRYGGYMTGSASRTPRGPGSTAVRVVHRPRARSGVEPGLPGQGWVMTVVGHIADVWWRGWIHFVRQGGSRVR